MKIMKSKNRKIVGTFILSWGLLYSLWCFLAYGYIKFKYGIELNDIWIYIDYPISKFLNIAEIHFGTFEISPELYRYTAAYFNQHQIVAWGFVDLINALDCRGVFRFLPWGAGFFAALSVLVTFIICKDLDDNTKAKMVRGAKITTAQDLVKQLRREQKKEQSGLFADPILIPHAYETRHVLIAGSTGTGKSVMLCQFIASVRQQKMLIYDRKGELFAKFGREKDILWNPYDKRFCGWSIFNEFELYEGLNHIPEELVNLANSLFSVASDNKNRAFYDGGASIFKSSCCYLKINGMTTNQELCDFFNAGVGKIKSAIDTLPKGLQEGLAFLIGEGDVVASFMSCLMEKTKAFQSLVGQDGDCSIRAWAKTRASDQTLFLSTAGENDTIYQPILTMLIDIIGSEIRAMPENPERRIYLFLDELSSLQPLVTLKMLLREGRSKGASCILGTQTMAAIEGKYGKADSADIFGLCNSLLIFRTNEPGQSEYFAKALGNVERIKIRQSNGESKKNGLSLGRGSKNTGESEQNITENLFLSGELQSLLVGCAIAKIAHFPIAKIQFKNIQISDKNAGFIKREMRFASDEELAKSRVKPLKVIEESKAEEVNTFDV